MKPSLCFQQCILFTLICIFQSIAAKDQITFTSLTPNQTESIELLFAPDDKPTNRLLEEIAKAKKRIYVAVYMLTDKKIAQALALAQERNVDVQIVADRASSDSPFGKIGYLTKHGIKIYIFNGQKYKKDTSFKPDEQLTEAQLQTPFKKKFKKKNFQHRSLKTNYAGLMHEKFGIFDDLIWLGSFNWTVSANKINQENILILKNKKILQQLLERFELLKSRCSEQYVCHEKQTVEKNIQYDLNQTATIQN